MLVSKMHTNTILVFELLKRCIAEGINNKCFWIDLADTKNATNPHITRRRKSNTSWIFYTDNFRIIVTSIRNMFYQFKILISYHNSIINCRRPNSVFLIKKNGHYLLISKNGLTCLIFNIRKYRGVCTSIPSE